MFTGVVRGIDLAFETANTIFSTLNIGSGTLEMISSVDLLCGDKLLDLSCGYGAIGIWAAKIKRIGVSANFNAWLVTKTARNGAIGG